MPNKSYLNGRKKEYRTMKKLRKIGCDIVFRSAGSHSEIDVIGIDIAKKRIFAIQCKPRSLSDNKKDEIAERNKLLNNNYLMTFEVI